MNLQVLFRCYILEMKEIPIKEYVQLARETKFVYIKCNMVELVDLAWGRNFHLGSNLNEE